MKTTLTRDEFQTVVAEQLLPSLIAKTVDAAIDATNEFLNPYIEDATIEGFDFEYDDEDRSTHIDVYYNDESSFRFTINPTMLSKELS